MLAQSITFGLAAPIYAIIHLITSPTARQPRPEGLIASPLDIGVVPFSIFVGYIIPSALTAFPETSTGPIRTLQERISFWQPWPIWVSVVQIVTSKALSFVCSTGDNDARHAKVQKVLSNSRVVYAFAFGLAALSHIAALSLSIISALFPTLFDPDVLHSLHPANVFVPTMPWSATKAKSLGQGVQDFLHYDHLVGVVAVLFWVLSLYTSAHSARNVKVNFVSLVSKIGALILTSGIAGTAVELMWERDEVLLADEGKRKEE